MPKFWWILLGYWNHLRKVHCSLCSAMHLLCSNFINYVQNLCGKLRDWIVCFNRFVDASYIILDRLRYMYRNRSWAYVCGCIYAGEYLFKTINFHMFKWSFWNEQNLNLSKVIFISNFWKKLRTYFRQEIAFLLVLVFCLNWFFKRPFCFAESFLNAVFQISREKIKLLTDFDSLAISFNIYLYLFKILQSITKLYLCFTPWLK